MLLSYEEAVQRYGPIVDLKWEKQSNYCSILQVPDFIYTRLVNSATSRPTTHIYCNNDFGGALLEAFYNIKNNNLLDELKTFDGCFQIRDVRGVPGKISAHAYAMAIDLNAATNALNAEGDMKPGFVKCFTDVGFIWGGSFTRKDPMHFQLVGW